MGYEKPDMDAQAAKAVLELHYGGEVEDVTAVVGGNLSRVFFFSREGKRFVLHFSDMQGAFRTAQYTSALLASQGVPYPRTLAVGTADGLIYSISERIEGTVVADLTAGQKNGLVPELTALLARMNRVDVGLTSGFGWIQADGSGSYASWNNYVAAFYGENQTGDFWENWHELFRAGILEKDVFDECYARLLAYAPYNAPHRHFVHNDCHAWNVLSDGRSVTGIIDANCVYGDFLIDLSIADGIVPGAGIAQLVREHHERSGFAVPDYEERMLGARYYKGLDALRFYAKMGWKPNYERERDFLLGLVD